MGEGQSKEPAPPVAITAEKALGCLGIQIHGRAGRYAGLLLLLALLTTAVLATGADSAKPVSKDEMLLRDRGYSAEAAARLARAFARVEAQDSIAPLLPLLEDKELPVACAAAFAAIAGDPDTAVPHVMKMLRQKKGSEMALLLALSFSPRRDTAKYLIDRLAAKHGAEHDEAVLFALQVMTGQAFQSVAEWNTWWRAHGAKEKLATPKSDVELQRRVFAAAAMLRSGTLRSAIAGAAEKPGEASHKADAIEDYASLLERGGKLRLSRPATNGDESFARGDIRQAAADYALAVKADPADQRSAYLRACAIFELGRRDEARAAWLAIEAKDPKAVGALFLAQLCQLPPGEPLLPAARAALEKTILYRGDTIGWDDPVLGILLAQYAAGNGPRAIPQDPLDEILEEAPNDVELRCGVAQCRPRITVAQAFTALREQFPKSALPLCGWLSVSCNKARVDKAALVAAAARWSEVEPANAMPALLAVAFQQPRDPKGEKLQAYDEATVAAVASGLARPELESRGRELCLAVRQVLVKIKFPFALEQLHYRPEFEEQMFDILSRMSDTEQARFEAGDLEEAERIGTTVDTLATRLMASHAGESIQAYFRVAAGFVIAHRRARLMAGGASGEALAELEQRISDLLGAGPNPSDARQKTLQILMLPTLEREMAMEELDAGQSGVAKP